MAFKNRLKEARSSKGLTQEQLGLQLNIAKSTVAGYERGSSEPDMAKLQKIMQILQVDANFLFQDEMLEQGSLNDVSAEMCLQPAEKKLIYDYRKLSTEGQEYIQKTMAMSLNTYGRNSASFNLQSSREATDPKQKNVI